MSQRKDLFELIENGHRGYEPVATVPEFGLLVVEIRPQRLIRARCAALDAVLRQVVGERLLDL